MLEIRDLVKSYGSVRALKGLSLQVEDGSLFGLMGQNGAGKTTLLRIAAGLLAPDRGQISADGLDLLQEPAEARFLIGFVPDTFGAYENLTVLQYLEFFASAYRYRGRNARVRCEELLDRVGMADLSGRETAALSRGMQQRLSISRALIHDPKYLLLDEPTSGLDPGSRFSVRELLGELCESGKTIVLSSHVLSELSEICTDIGILEDGRVKVTGEVSEILAKIEHSNPLKISVVSGEETAMGIFRRNPYVRSVMRSGKTFSLEFEGGGEEEAALLRDLIEAEIPVNGFMREPGSLESFFLKMTSDNRERVILDNDDEESDL